MIYRFGMYSIGYIAAQINAQSVVPYRAPSCHYIDLCDSGPFSFFYIYINICHCEYLVNILSLLQRAQQQLPHRTATCTSQPQGPRESVRMTHGSSQYSPLFLSLLIFLLLLTPPPPNG